MINDESLASQITFQAIPGVSFVQSTVEFATETTSCCLCAWDLTFYFRPLLIEISGARWYSFTHKYETINDNIMRHFFLAHIYRYGVHMPFVCLQHSAFGPLQVNEKIVRIDSDTENHCARRTGIFRHYQTSRQSELSLWICPWSSAVLCDTGFHESHLRLKLVTMTRPQSFWSSALKTEAWKLKWFSFLCFVCTVCLCHFVMSLELTQAASCNIAGHLLDILYYTPF